MSNTLKFGNGKWATKEGSTLAYNDNNGNFKPLPFNFERSTSATRVNKNGLIEVVSNNEPRIDFTNDSKGALLLEPSRTNLIPYSNDFNQHDITGGSITSDNIISPNGVVNSDTFVEDVANSQHKIREDISVTAGTYTMSVFIKGTDRFISLYPQSAGTAFAVFDIENATITKTGGSDYINSDIQNYGNGWYRCILTYTVSAGTSFLNIYLSNISTGTGAEAPIYTGNSSEMSFYGLQLEAGSYPTSYIPTSGATATRNAEASSKANISNLINSSEGVLYAEISALANDQTNRLISLTNGTSSERISLFYSQDFSNEIKGIVFVGGVATAQLSFISNDITDTSKIALKYKQNDFALWVNGIEVVSEDNGTVPSGLNKLAFDLGISSTVLPFYGNIKDLRVYNIALTDAELISLTS